MVGHRTCIYEQFGSCKNGENCQFQHPTLVCDDQKNCEIALCHKRHPQLCLYDTIFNNCMNEDSDTCRFHHRNRDDSNDDNEILYVKYKDLEKKYDALFENCQTMIKRIEDLENDKKKNVPVQIIESSKHDDVKFTRIHEGKRKRSHGDVNMKRSKSAENIKMNTIEEKSPVKKSSKIVTESMITDDNEEKEVDTSVELQHYIKMFGLIEKEMTKIRTFVVNNRMVAKNIEKTKNMMQSINCGTKLDKKYRTERMDNISNVVCGIVESTYNKILKSESTQFRTVAMKELENLVKVCKKERMKIEKQI